MVIKSARKKAGYSAGFEPTKQQKKGKAMKFLEKSLTASTSGEQIKNAVRCTFWAHAAGVKSAATVRYSDKSGIEKTFFAVTTALEPLFTAARNYDDEVIAACLLVAGYRSGRDLTALENAVKTAESSAAPLDKRDTDLRKSAAACGDGDEKKHAAALKDLDALKPELEKARDTLEKARAALELACLTDIHSFMRGFEKRAAMLTAVSEWLYQNAADKFAAIAAAADTAVRERAEDFAGRMLAYCDFIAADDAFPLNNKGRRCSCADVIETAILKAVKRPFNGGVGYKHTATGGLRYADVPASAGLEVTITKVTE